MSDDVQDWRAVLDGRREWAVVLGDCLDVLRELPAGSVDAVVTDPPYGMSWQMNAKPGPRGHGRATDRTRHYGHRVIADSAPFDPAPWLTFPRVVMFGANHFGARLPVGTTLVWIKRLDSAFGSFLSDAEVAWMKGGHGVYCRRDMSFNTETRERVHPTQKPVGLMAWCMERAKVPVGDVVIDPYAGSGTTGVACIQTGRRFIGVEIDPTYHAIAVERLTKAAAARQPSLPGIGAAV